MDTQEPLPGFFTEPAEPMIGRVGVQGCAVPAYKEPVAVLPLVAQPEPLGGLGRFVVAQDGNCLLYTSPSPRDS